MANADVLTVEAAREIVDEAIEAALVSVGDTDAVHLQDMDAVDDAIDRLIEAVRAEKPAPQAKQVIGSRVVDGEHVYVTTDDGPS